MKTKATATLVAFSLLACALVVACYSVDFGADGKFFCRDNNRSCPEGFVCQNDVCVRPGGPAPDLTQNDTTADGDISVPDEIGVTDIARPDQGPTKTCTLAGKALTIADTVHSKGVYGVGFDAVERALWVSFSRPRSAGPDAATLFVRRSRAGDPTLFEPEVKLVSQAAPFSAIDGYKGLFVVVYPNEKGELGATSGGISAPKTSRLDVRTGVSFVAARAEPASDPQIVYVAYTSNEQAELHALSVTRGALSIKDAPKLVDKAPLGGGKVGLSLNIATEPIINNPAIALAYFKSNPLKNNFDVVRALRAAALQNWTTKALGATVTNNRLQVGVAMQTGAHLAHATGLNATVTYVAPNGTPATVTLDDGTAPRNAAYAAIAVSKAQQAIAYVDDAGALQLTTRSGGAWRASTLVDNSGGKGDTRLLDVTGASGSDATRRYVVLWREKAGSTDRIRAAMLECAR